jgi:hypothetical protein
VVAVAATVEARRGGEQKKSAPFESVASTVKERTKGVQ